MKWKAGLTLSVLVSAFLQLDHEGFKRFHKSELSRAALSPRFKVFLFQFLRLPVQLGSGRRQRRQILSLGTQGKSRLFSGPPLAGWMS
jgi:hypothetical protein